MNKIKILAIAPYSGLKALINELADEQAGLDVHTYVADMLDGVELVKSIRNDDYDAIISRAGTAELIRKVTTLPVIDIKLSVIDMMQAIKLAQNYSGKFVVVGYKSITEIAKNVCQLIQYDVEIKTISNIQEIDDCLTEFKTSGISLIVGDVITIQRAKSLGLNTVLVNSGRESVLNAFDEVSRFCHLLLNTHYKSQIIRQILENEDGSVISYTHDKNIFYSNFKETFDEKRKLLEEIEGFIDVLNEEKEFKIIRKINNHIITIKGVLISFDNFLYPTFYIKSHEATIKNIDEAISYTHLVDSPPINFDTYFTSNKSFNIVLESAKSYSKTQAPIILFGDKGTGKDTLALAIYHTSHFNKNSLITIDTSYMTEKKWISLFESENSLFLNNEFTFYIKNLHCIDEQSQSLFESYFLNSYVHKRNRFIFSCINGYSKSFDNSNLLDFIRNKLNAFPLVLPNLNQRSEDIPSLASLYLSELNLKYGKQVIGLEKDALALLQEFHWRYNLNQFQRVIEEMLILTDSYYISPNTVEQVLANEDQHHANSYVNIDLNKSIDEITKDIIEIVLNEEDYNQSKAAERLGISRSTLWRKIKVK